MFDLGEVSKFNVRNAIQLRGSAWPVLKRLLAYTLQYKFKLGVSILFALVVAVSFTVMILGVAGVVQVVFGKAEAVYSQVDRYAHHAEGLPAWVQSLLLHLPLPQALPEEIAPPDSSESPPSAMQEKFRGVVALMRQRRMPALTLACGIILVLTVLAGLARYFQEYFAGLVGASISVQLAREMIENILKCSLRFFEQHPSGEILARLTNDVFQVNRGLANVFVKVFREPFKMVFFLAVAISADPALTLIGLCVLPPVVLIIIKVGKRFKRSMRRSLQSVASLASVGNEVFNGIMVVKGYCMEPYELRRAESELGKLHRHLAKMVRADAAIGPLVETVLILGVIGFVLITSYRVEQGVVTPDRLVKLVFALAMILDPVRKLSSVNNMVMGSVASAERVFEFIDVKPDIVEKPDAVELPPLREAIRFHHVSFSYDGNRDVICGIDLEIRKGQIVAIVGFSGAGKSTLAKLIPRFYDVTGGAITIDGVDIRDVTLKSLRGQIGLVTQDTILFNETVRDNITFGEMVFSDERVRQAAQAAHAHEFICALPQGYDTVIGESGGTLSGGQRQRLAIARAIIKDPAILILDEATSNLDSESERAIQEAIDRFIAGRTTLVIAHRLSTVLRADRILVMDKGRIVEQGTHQELLARGGLYRKLYETQFGALKDTTE